MFRRAQGFTLLELLVVIVIIGITVSFAVLSLGLQSPQAELEEHARRIRAVMLLAGEEAVLQGQELAMQLDGRRYYFLGPKGKDWLRINDDRVLRERELPEHIRAELSIEGGFVTQGKAVTPRVVFFSSGEITPFTLTLTSREAERAVSLSGDIQGVIKDDSNE